MLQQFKSMNELTECLRLLEERIKVLETDNGKLKLAAPNTENVDRNIIARYVSAHLPKTNLISPNFFKRAFAVWGHFFVANLIIGITVGIAYACLMMVFFGSIFGSLIQNSK